MGLWVRSIQPAFSNAVKAFETLLSDRLVRSANSVRVGVTIDELRSAARSQRASQTAAPQGRLRTNSARLAVWERFFFLQAYLDCGMIVGRWGVIARVPLRIVGRGDRKAPCPVSIFLSFAAPMLAVPLICLVTRGGDCR